MWKMPRIWDGGICYIIGGGASIPYQFDVPKEIIEEVKAKRHPISAYSPYMKALHDKHVIGVNEAYKIGNWVDIMFFGDSGYWDRQYKEIIQFPKLKITIRDVDHPDVKVMGRSRNTGGLTDKPHLLVWNKNSGAAAINLAVHTGAKKIVLLGFDMNLKFGGQHWHGSYSQRAEDRVKRTFARHMDKFSQIAKDAGKLGVKILNANPGSEIDVFEKVHIKDVL